MYIKKEGKKGEKVQQDKKVTEKYNIKTQSRRVIDRELKKWDNW